MSSTEKTGVAVAEWDEEQKLKDPNLELHTLLDENELVRIKEIFDSKDGKRMNREEFKDMLLDVAKIQFDDERFNMEFLKINAQCNNLVSWDEFISYLILGYQQQEVSVGFKTLDNPIPAPPTLLKSNHRHAINRITFYPTVKPDRSFAWSDGSIVTCSYEGVINYWSLDMRFERSVQSKCPYLKIRSTWVTDVAILPDISVICTSSTERDLRFYDTSARKFELRVMITSFPNAITTLHYCFDKNVNIPSKLVVGDMLGHVRILFINTEGRGPFRSQPGVLLHSVRYEKVKEGNFPDITISEFLNIHTDFVRQVSYYSSLNYIVSCADGAKGLVLTNVLDSKTYSFKLYAGVWCFAVQEEEHILATGGPDCAARIWNVFMPGRPVSTFYGHHTGIVQMIFQDQGQKLYTLSKDKCIKVWDVGMQCQLQTYLELPSQLGGERNPMVTWYNPLSRDWIIGCVMVAVVPLNPRMSSEHSEGNTHTSGVSVILYNKLFKSIVTCGLDSYIIVWDPWDGRRLLVIKNAHTVTMHGEIKSVEITAATFDPGFQRLLTGAHDGTLKIWNFNTGTCLRNMKIERWTEVRSVIWVKNRILAMGWNKRVTEFADTGEAIGPGGAFSKNWDLRHADDISTGAVREPETLATATYSGEMIFWRLETGQPYKKFNVLRPTERIKLYYTKTKDIKIEAPKTEPSKSSVAQRMSITLSGGIRQSMTRGSFSKPHPHAVVQTRHAPVSDLSGPAKIAAKSKHSKQRRVSTVAMPDYCFGVRPVGVHCLLFLETRKSDPEVGTLLVALENGLIQVWNHHVAGGFITSFEAHHKAGDYVISMATDKNNEFLFVGTTVGYIKTYLLKNYCVREKDKVHICMPKYRLMFPFTWGDRFLGRARRMVLSQPFPKLLSSFKGHFRPISSLTYLDDCQILISCSADYSARMWTLGGRYLQTIGTFKPWKKISSTEPVPENFDFTVPVDIKRVASSTTLRVLMGGTFPKRLTIKQLQKQAQKDLVHVDYNKIFGRHLEEPILGNHIKPEPRDIPYRPIYFDTSFPHIPVYSSLFVSPPKNIDLDVKQLTYKKEEDRERNEKKQKLLKELRLKKEQEEQERERAEREKEERGSKDDSESEFP